MSKNRTFIAILFMLGLSVLGLVLLRRGEPVPTNTGPDGSPRAAADQEVLQLFCAAGMKMPVAELAKAFEAKYGCRVQIQYGGSGTLLSNLQVAQQGDLYIAADSSYTDIAHEKGLIDETLPLAYIRPVIAVPTGNPLGLQTTADLTRPGLRLALGNPDAASIGKQTRTTLEAAGLWDAVKARVEADGVFKPTVPEVANDVKLGAVDAAVIWDATVAQYTGLEAVHTPEFDAARKEITVAILKTSAKPTLALRFARYLNSTEGNAVFRAHGYESVDGDTWEWAPEITFFAGAVNRRAVEDVVHAFEKREGVTVNTVYNGCGILTAQMDAMGEGGAGFPDTYMACDTYYMDTVIDWFQDDTVVSEAAIVIVTPKNNPAGIKTLADLARPGVRVSLGQPKQCTIGVLSERLLVSQGIKDAVAANVVAQMPSSAMLVPSVVTDAADATLAYRTDAMAQREQVTIIAIDAPLAKAVQPFGVAKSSSYKHLGHRLFQRIVSARAAFEDAGFVYRYDGPGAAPASVGERP